MQLDGLAHAQGCINDGLRLRPNTSCNDLIGLAGCVPPPPAPGAVEQGRALFVSREMSPSAHNVFSCASCHDVVPPGSGAPIKTGALLAGATRRPSFWGAQTDDLLAAIDVCRSQFMLATAPLEASSAEAAALCAFLAALEPGDPDAAAFTIVRTIDELPRGDAASGAALFGRTCAACHGEAHTANGRLAARVPVLPDQTLRDHAAYDPRSQRLIFIEKIRHGGFLGYGGDMPPFSAERLSDEDVSDVLEALGVLGV